MNVAEIMTTGPAYASPDTPLQEVASIMVHQDCGQIPICDRASAKPIGVVTDRDIVCRTIARGLNPLNMKASECMSEPCVTVSVDASLDECCRLMEKYQVRRLPVVDERGELCGIVSQADVAHHHLEAHAGRLLKSLSQPRQTVLREQRQGQRAA
ncbi:MAG TPA: CBS domain-containing protein [Verrucomicrobiae bacterium]|nr:CBS domain-containing protein [Verrucomicrobiae bacterium]